MRSASYPSTANGVKGRSFDIQRGGVTVARLTLNQKAIGFDSLPCCQGLDKLSVTLYNPRPMTTTATQSRAWRERQKAEDPDYHRKHRDRMRAIRAAPGYQRPSQARPKALRLCRDCDAPMPGVQGNVKYCPKCKELRRQEEVRRNAARRRERYHEDPVFRAYRIAVVQERGYASEANKQTLIARDGLYCGICKEPLPADLAGVHVDHIWPRARGGGDEIENLQLAHGRCNMSKRHSGCSSV